MANKIMIMAGANVDGDVTCRILTVEEGALFEGRSHRVANSDHITPQLERPAKTAAPARGQAAVA